MLEIFTISASALLTTRLAALSTFARIVILGRGPSLLCPLRVLLRVILLVLLIGLLTLLPFSLLVLLVGLLALPLSLLVLLIGLLALLPLSLFTIRLVAILLIRHDIFP